MILCKTAQFVGSILHHRNDTFGSLIHQKTGIGQGDSAGAAFHQFDAKFFFQSNDLFAQRRLGEIEILCGGGDASKADYLKNIPIWTYHGTADPTVQFKGTQEMYNSIVAAGGEKIKFNAVEGAGHNVWDAATTNGELIDWLFANKLSDRMPKEEVTTEPEADPEIPTTQAPDNTDKKDGGCSGSASVLAVPAAVMLGAAVVLKKKKEDRA